MYECTFTWGNYRGPCALKIVKIEPQYTQSQKVSLVPFDVNVFIKENVRFLAIRLLLHQKICLSIKNEPSLRIHEEFIYLEKFTYSKFQEVEQLTNEINILEKIRHNRVVAYYGSVEKDDHLHLFMELMTGVSLKKSNI